MIEYKRLKLVFELSNDDTNPTKFLERLIENDNFTILVMLQIAIDNNLGTGYEIGLETYDLSKTYGAKEMAYDLLRSHKTIVSFSGNITGKNTVDVMNINDCEEYDLIHILKNLGIPQYEYRILGEKDFARLVELWREDEEFGTDVYEAIKNADDWAQKYADKLDPYFY